MGICQVEMGKEALPGQRKCISIGAGEGKCEHIQDTKNVGQKRVQRNNGRNSWSRNWSTLQTVLSARLRYVGFLRGP